MAEDSSFNYLRFACRTLKTARWIVILGLGGLALVFGSEFLLNALFTNSPQLNALGFVKFVRSTTEPVINTLIGLLRFKTRVHDVEMMPLAVAVGFYFVMTFLSRQALQLAAVVDAEDQLRQMRKRKEESKSIDGLSFSSTSTDKAVRGFWGRFMRRKEAERDRMLRDFEQAKKRLEKTKQRLAFLSIDIVGSTRIKVGADRLLSEKLFREYRYLLEQIFKKYRYRAASWTPDGVMVCFSHVDMACSAAKELLGKLPEFNKTKNPLDFAVQVRCGLNAGEVYYDGSTPLELLSDHVLDITGHLQKFARPDSLLVTEEIFGQLREKKDFAVGEKEVDGYKVFEWSQVLAAPGPKVN